MEIFGFSEWIIAIVIGLISLYLYTTWNFNYFEKYGIKTDPPIPLLGNIHQRYYNKYVHETDQEAYRRLGKVHGIYEGRSPLLIVGDPEIIKLVLVKNFSNFTDRRVIKMSSKTQVIERFLTLLRGEEWRAARHALSPAFTSGKLKQMGELMEQCTERMLEIIEKDFCSEQSTNIDVRMKLGLYTINVIASCAFGINMNSMSTDDLFYKHGKAIFGQEMSLRTAILFTFPPLGRLLNLEFFPVESINYFVDTAKEVIKKRKSGSIKRTDFLQLLLEAQQEEIANDSGRENKKGKGVLDEPTVIAQAMLFLLAGFDTVAALLSFVLHSLATNPECQEKLYNDIEEAKKKHGKLNHEAAQQSEYLDMVISETLRMYPITTRLDRSCTSDCTIGNVPIKKGMVVTVPVYAVHYDEENYPEPNKFNPERFSPENKSAINPYIYLPFGTGPRNCIGMRFALMQCKIVLALIVNKYKFSVCSETEVPINMKRMFGMIIPKDKVTLKVEQRN